MMKFKRMRETNVGNMARMTGASRYCPEQGIESMKKILETNLRFSLLDDLLSPYPK